MSSSHKSMIYFFQLSISSIRYLLDLVQMVSVFDSVQQH